MGFCHDTSLVTLVWGCSRSLSTSLFYLDTQKSRQQLLRISKDERPTNAGHFWTISMDTAPDVYCLLYTPYCCVSAYFQLVHRHHLDCRIDRCYRPPDTTGRGYDDREVRRSVPFLHGEYRQIHTSGENERTYRKEKRYILNSSVDWIRGKHLSYGLIPVRDLGPSCVAVMV
jgi:hypothetical protein